MYKPTHYRPRAHSPVRTSFPLVLTIVAAILMAVALTLTACVGTGNQQASVSPPPPAASDTLPLENGPSPDETGLPAVLPGDGTETAAPESPAPEETEELTAGYDFTQPVPESDPAADDYFADAVFVGDSRTAGFMMYSGVTGASSVTHTGLSIFDIQNGKACIQSEGKQITVQQALSGKNCGKIYLCLGVNELGYPNDQKYYEAYCAVVEQLKASHPDAVIYLQTLIPLNEEVVAATGGRSYLENDHLRAYNDLIRQVGADYQVPVVDVYSGFADETGSLPADASNDGVHLNRSYCEQWLEYLKTHTVSHDTLYPEGADAT